jgi:hypothetical protein
MSSGLQPVHVLLLGASFCFVIFWALVIVGIATLVRRSSQR